MRRLACNRPLRPVPPLLCRPAAYFMRTLLRWQRAHFRVSKHIFADSNASLMSTPAPSRLRLSCVLSRVLLMPRPLVAKEDFLKILQVSARELIDHTKSGTVAIDLSRPNIVLRGCFQSSSRRAKLGHEKGAAGEAQFDVWWKRPEQRDFPVLLWEEWAVEGLTRAEFEFLMSEARGFEGITQALADEQWLPEGSLPQTQPTWKYHPERFAALMPFAPVVAKVGRQAQGLLSVEQLNELAAAWQAADGYSIAARPLRERIASKSRNSRRMFELVDLLVFNASFCGSGRQIFDVAPELVEMFKHTDVDEVITNQIKVPYSTVYLHFGPQPEWTWEEGWTPEGAYVTKIDDEAGEPQVLQICLVCAPADLADYSRFDINIEPVYTQALGPEHVNLPIGKAVEAVLDAKMAELRRQVSEEPLANPHEEIKQLAAEQGIELRSVQATRAKEELATIARRHEVYLAALKLIINSLAFLTAYPEDSQSDWSRTLPADLAKGLSAPSSKVRVRTQSKLSAMGYSRVTLCGRKAVSGLAAPAAGGGTVAAHWRRGHWRQQAYGPQSSLRKLVWVLPVMVNAGKALTDAPGHIYAVHG